MPIKSSQSDEMSNEKDLNGKENRQVSSTTFVMSWVKNYRRNMNLLMRSTDDDVDVVECFDFY